ncbi:MAG: phosphoribosyl-AMP cyclohydrolase [Kordiimonadales bacterium]|nr:MAG: phosphoribosyl-AMP cyclohydrolase [Kordiimonadales bacterium]
MAPAAFTVRTDKDAIENGDVFMPKFDDRGLIPVFTSCAETGKVLMQAWMNGEAIERTIATGEAHYFSRSRGELWHKGATSGEFQIVKEFRTDCDQDSLWLSVVQKGGKCCHVGHESCFYRSIPVGPAASSSKTVKLVSEAKQKLT